MAGHRTHPQQRSIQSGMPTAAPLPGPELRIVLNDAAPPELREVGKAYWTLVGIDAETGEPRWEHQVSDLPYGTWSGSAHYVAAAAATVTLPDYVCAACAGDLILTSRQALADALAGKSVRCRTCQPRIDEHAARILDPRSLDTRAQRATKALEQRATQQAERDREDARRAVIAERYPVEPEDQDQLIASAPLLAKLGALAVLHAVGDKKGLIYPIDTDDQRIAPTATLGAELFRAAWHHGLLKIHPSSPTTAFLWNDDTTLSGSLYPGLAKFFMPGDGPVDTRLASFADRLRAGLDVTAMWSTERAELASLAQRLIAEEAGRYFAFKLREHRLPDLTETHEEALRTATKRGAGLFPLGHLYRMAWTSARDASSAYQRHTGMPKEKSITHGLNQFEGRIQAASEDPGALPEPFGEDKHAVALSAITRIVFHTLLGLDPMRAGPAEIADALTGSPESELLRQCDESIPDRTELMAWLRTSTDQWDGSEFRMILGVLDQWTPHLCAPGCAHAHIGSIAGECARIYDRIVSRVDETDAAILTAEATAIANVVHEGVRSGDAVLTAVVETLQARRAQRSDEL
ncbi:hypothetical protein [Rhodococcus rhodochrous]|uniref:Uncharacterized protein n=1 Tax=Rhodococcus rhodochrous TaxID=1829 RepID=A0AA46X2X6_RHORH|nr:hypothetical protein [Rhodococcus rhodochrous]UZF48415.1 hypothetical protein KUM34_028980 [Rhodococcus rhodochrous]